MLDRLQVAEAHLAAARAEYQLGNKRVAVADLELAAKAVVEALVRLTLEVVR